MRCVNAGRGGAARHCCPPPPPHPPPQECQETASVRFREVAEAYEILSDAEKRQRYDNGEDVTGQQQQQNHFHQQGFHPFFPHGHPGGGGGGFNFQFRHG